MMPTSLFETIARWATAKYSIVDKKTGEEVIAQDLSFALFKNMKNFEMFRNVYNSCVESFNRLSPTHRTLFFVYIKDSFNKHFDELNLSELHDCISWISNRLK